MLRFLSFVPMLALLPALLFLAPLYARPNGNEPIIAYAGFVAGDAKRTRISIDFDREPKIELRYSSEPPRIVLDLPPTVFRLGGLLDDSDSPALARVSYDVTRPDRSRIILDLDGPLRAVARSLEPIGNTDRRRLLLDLEPVSQKAFDALVARSPPPPETAPSGNRPAVAERPLILLDPGHGGRDGGAVGRRRTVEKDVTLAFAKVLRGALQRTGRFETRLTRDRDVFVPLSRRVQRARESGAALFISIHADSLRQRRIRGATVYTLSKEASDDISAKLATEQNRADLSVDLEQPELDRGAADILLDLMQRETDETSIQVAERVVAALGAATRLIGNPNRSADFHVLRSPDVPSVLVELGYLSNVEDEKLMASEAWQRKVAASLAEGLVDYFDGERSLAKR